MNRRQFLSKFGKSVLILPGLSFNFGFNQDLNIDEIKVYRYDINKARHFSWGSWYNRQHAFVKFQIGEYVGWSEMIASKNKPDLDIAEWGAFLKPFKGMKLSEAYKLINEQKDDSKRMLDLGQLEFIEIALLDLQGRIENIPTVMLLEMNQNQSVPGLFTILQKDLSVIDSQIEDAIHLNLNSHVKFKMFGNKSLDLNIAKLARKKLGTNAMILGDANRGYKNWSDINELANTLINLNNAGLDAMEDPANMTVDQWVKLQKLVKPLKMVPDHPMRPSWKAIEIIKSGMGEVYNFHPGSMGSVYHLNLLAKKIKKFNARIMIGDDSLVGPACNAWQQIAIGAGADWVEAIEKAGESENYLASVKSKPTFRDESGRFAANFKPGFGLELDEKKLDKYCKNAVSY